MSSFNLLHYNYSQPPISSHLQSTDTVIGGESHPRDTNAFTDSGLGILQFERLGVKNDNREISKIRKKFRQKLTNRMKSFIPIL